MRWFPREELKNEVDSKDHALLDEVVERILDKVTATTEFEIELQIHDLLLKNVKYVDKEKVTEHTIEGPLLNKKAVCEGIAKAMKYLMNKKGLRCELVLGKLTEDTSVYHAWNIVRIDGYWYHVDVTADIGMTDGGIYRYDYFNLSDEEISVDHQIIECPVKCHVSKDGYYHRKGLVMNRQDDFKRLLSDKLAQGESEFVFKLPSAKDADKVVQKIMDNVNEVLRSKRHGYRQYQISPNSTQLVYKLKLW